MTGNDTSGNDRKWQEMTGNDRKWQEMIRQEMSGNCDKKQLPEWNWKKHFMTKYSSFWNSDRMGHQSDSLDRDRVLAVKNTLQHLKLGKSNWVFNKLNEIKDPNSLKVWQLIFLTLKIGLKATSAYIYLRLSSIWLHSSSMQRLHYYFLTFTACF